MPTSLLIDLDGVVRYWDPEHVAQVERRHGVPVGSVAAAAFGEDSALQQVVTGRITDEDWRADVVRRLEPLCGDSAPAVVAAWADSSGAVVPEVLSVVRRARETGWTVGLLTNATSRLGADLRLLELTDEFDVVLNSAELGVAKPDPVIFRLACERMQVAPHACVFVDDTEANVVAAARAGLDAHVFEDADALAELLFGAT